MEHVNTGLQRCSTVHLVAGGNTEGLAAAETLIKELTWAQKLQSCAE